MFTWISFSIKIFRSTEETEHAAVSVTCKPVLYCFVTYVSIQNSYEHWPYQKSVIPRFEDGDAIKIWSLWWNTWWLHGHLETYLMGLTYPQTMYYCCSCAHVCLAIPMLICWSIKKSHGSIRCKHNCHICLCSPWIWTFWDGCVS